MAKIYKSYETLQQDLEKIRSGKKLVFTNGCFDILHPGHIHVLKRAKELGDILVVGLNSDSSVRQLKGDRRPILSERDRAQMLSALEMVDYVVIFEEQTPLEVIKALRPDVLVKGAQYGKGEVVGEDIALKTVRIEMVPGYSTSEIVKKIKES